MREQQGYCADCQRHTPHLSRWDKERHGQLSTCLDCGHQAVYYDRRRKRERAADNAAIAEGLAVPSALLPAYVVVGPDGDEP